MRINEADSLPFWGEIIREVGHWVRVATLYNGAHVLYILSWQCLIGEGATSCYTDARLYNKCTNACTAYVLQFTLSYMYKILCKPQMQTSYNEMQTICQSNTCILRLHSLYVLLHAIPCDLGTFCHLEMDSLIVLFLFWYGYFGWVLYLLLHSCAKTGTALARL